MQAQCQAQEVEGRGQDSRLHAIDLAELRMGNTKLVKGMEERVKQVALQKLASGRSAQVQTVDTNKGGQGSRRLCFSFLIQIDTEPRSFQAGGDPLVASLLRGSAEKTIGIPHFPQPDEDCDACKCHIACVWQLNTQCIENTKGKCPPSMSQTQQRHFP